MAVSLWGKNETCSDHNSAGCDNNVAGARPCAAGAQFAEHYSHADFIDQAQLFANGINQESRSRLWQRGHPERADLPIDHVR